MHRDELDKNYHDFDTNQYASFTKMFRVEEHFSPFAKLSGDNNPLHHDVEYAGYTEYAKPIVPMHLATLPLSTIAGMIFPGHRSLYLSTTIDALKPIYYDDEVTYSSKIISKSDSTQILKIRTIIYKSTTVLLSADQVVKVRQDAIPDSALEKIQRSHISIQRIKPKVLITGASGEIGKCTALAFAKAGFDLILHYQKNKQSIQSVVEHCQRYGVHVEVHQANLSAQKEIEKFTLALRNETISHFIHIASSGLDSEIDELMSTNFIALKKLSETLLPNMLRQQLGHILFIGSSAIHSYPPEWENYIAAKTAGVSLINSIHKHYQAYGIKAITISPGLVITPFSAQIRGKEYTALLPEQVANAILEALQLKEITSYYCCDITGNRAGTYGLSLQDKLNQTESQYQLLNEKSVDQDRVSTDIKSKLNRIIKSFFKLNDAFELEGSSFENYNSWDSLKHIQFLLEVESKFNIKFASHVLDKTVTYNELVDLIGLTTVGTA